MQFQKNGVTVSVDDSEVRRLVLERLGECESTPNVPFGTICVPRIGAEWHGRGGIYAGIARGLDGAPDYHLIVGPEYDGKLDWLAANTWAADLRLHGFSDYSLPRRKEQSLTTENK